MENNSKKISVIVPAYNVEKYIEKCVNSLIGQTYNNIEILVVDDGSTDNTGRILDEKYKYDARVLVFHKENGGLSDARNYGLDRMTGDFVTFVDSDDFVDKDYFSYLMELANFGADIVVIPPQPFFDDNHINTVFDFGYEVVDCQEAVRRMLVRKGIAHTACGKLYKSSLWDSERFPYKELYEDYHTTFDVFSKANRIAIGKAAMYFYFQRSSSIMHYECNKCTTRIIDATNQVTPRIEKYWPELRVEAADLQMALCLKCLQSIYSSVSVGFEDEKKKIWDIRKKNAWKLLKSNKINNRDKVKILISYLPSSIYKALYNKFDGNKEKAVNG